MNSMKIFSVTFSLVLVGLMIAPTSDAFYLFHPLHVFYAAKLGTMAVIGKGAALAAVAVPVVAKGAVLGKAAVVGGVAGGKAGLKTGLLAAKAKAPLFLAKSAVPNLLSLAPLLKGKKSTKTVARAAPLAPLPPPPPPMLPPPAYAPSYPQQAPVRSGY